MAWIRGRVLAVHLVGAFVAQVGIELFEIEEVQVLHRHLGTYPTPPRRHTSEIHGGVEATCISYSVITSAATVILTSLGGTNAICALILSSARLAETFS